MRYANKRLAFRAGDGRFRKATMEDVGLGGVCPKCGHFYMRRYSGDPADAFLDPRLWVYRCAGCGEVKA